MTLEVLENKTETPGLETQAAAPPDSTSTGTETPPSEAEGQDSDPLAAYEAEIGITQAGTEGTQGESAAQNPSEEPSPEVLEAAARLRASERAEETRQRQANGLLSDFGTRAQRLRSHLTQVAAGQVRLDIEGVLAQFNAHHAQSDPIIRQQAARQFADSLYQAAEDFAPGAGRNRAEHKTTADLMKDVVTTARNGYVSKKDHEAAVKQAGIEQYKKLSEKPEVLRALLSKLEGSAGGGNGTSSPSGPLTLERSLTMPVAELMKLQQAGKL